MIRRESTVAVGLVVMLLLGLGGCGGKFRLSAKTMCEAHGGTYNGSTQLCTYTAQQRSVRQACQQQGGYYDDAAQFCEIGRD